VPVSVLDGVPDPVPVDPTEPSPPVFEDELGVPPPVLLPLGELLLSSGPVDGPELLEDEAPPVAAPLLLLLAVE